MLLLRAQQVPLRDSFDARLVWIERRPLDPWLAASCRGDPVPPLGFDCCARVWGTLSTLRTSTWCPLDLTERTGASSSVNLWKAPSRSSWQDRLKSTPCAAFSLTNQVTQNPRLPVRPPERLHLCPRLCWLAVPLRCRGRRPRQLEVTFVPIVCYRSLERGGDKAHRGHTWRHWTEPLGSRPTETTASAVACVAQSSQRFRFWRGSVYYPYETFLLRELLPGRLAPAVSCDEPARASDERIGSTGSIAGRLSAWLVG